MYITRSSKVNYLRYAVIQAFHLLFVSIYSPPPPPGRMGLGDDPHYSILLPSGQLLCYSVQGEHNFTFNLISNSLLQMNALFVPDKVREEVTWIGGLGLVVKHSAYKDSTVTRLRFALEGKMLFIGDKVKLSVKNVESITLSGGKLTVSEADNDVQVPEVKVG